MQHLKLRTFPVSSTHFAKVNMPVIGVGAPHSDALFVTPIIKAKWFHQPGQESIKSKLHYSTVSAFSLSARLPTSVELSADFFPNQFDL